MPRCSAQRGGWERLRRRRNRCATARGSQEHNARLDAQRAVIGMRRGWGPMTSSRWSLPRRQCLRFGEAGISPSHTKYPNLTNFAQQKYSGWKQRLEHILSYSSSPTLSPSLHSDTRWSQLRFRAELPELPATRTPTFLHTAPDYIPRIETAPSLVPHSLQRHPRRL
jgi:hypothetical protein